jgi:hypothetical protein
VTAPDHLVPLQPTAPAAAERLFPTLTDAQLARIAARGKRRQTVQDEVLVEVGDKTVPFFVVVSGALQVLRPSDRPGTLIVTHRRGQFSGEVSMITGRRALARNRVGEPGEAIELDREQLLALVQTDAELRAILMRAFINSWFSPGRPRSCREGTSHEANVSEEVLPAGRDSSIPRTWSDCAGQLLMEGHLEHHDHGLAHDARVLARVVR